MPPVSIFCNHCGFASSEDAQFCQRCGASLGPPQVTPAATLVRYGGFWIRVLAAVIDSLLIFAVAFPARFLLGSTVTALGMNFRVPIHQTLHFWRIVRISTATLIAWPYKAGMEASHYQATLGKLAMRLKVTDIDGNRISFARASGRFFAKYLSMAALCIGYLMVAFDEQKQGLHDQIARTLVLRVRGRC